MADDFRASRFDNARQQAREIARQAKKAKRSKSKSQTKGFGGEAPATSRKQARKNISDIQIDRLQELAEQSAAEPIPGRVAREVEVVGTNSNYIPNPDKPGSYMRKPPELPRPSLMDRVKASAELINERRASAAIAELQAQGSAEKAEKLRQTITARRADKVKSRSKQRFASDAFTEAKGKRILRDLNTQKQLIDAGAPESAMPGRTQYMEDILGTLKNDTELIPGPLVINETSPSGVNFERRYHTRFNERGEAVPFLDPNKNNPLSTFFGDAAELHLEGINVDGIDIDPRWEGNSTNYRTGKPVIFNKNVRRSLKAQQGDKASEYLAQRIGYLSEEPYLKDMNFKNNVVPDDFYNATSLSDWERASESMMGVDFESNGLGIDAEYEYRGNNTRLHPQGNKVQVRSGLKNPNGYKDGQIKQMIELEMQNGLNVEEAIDSLIAKGSFDKTTVKNKPGKDMGKGKLIKTDDVGNFTHNILLKPQISDENIGFRQGPTYLQDKVVHKPIGAKSINLDTLRSGIAMSDDPKVAKSLQVKGGFAGKRVDMIISDANEAVTDLSFKGHVPQILERLNYVDTPVSRIDTPMPSGSRAGKGSAIDEVVQKAAKSRLVKNGIKLIPGAAAVAGVVFDAGDVKAGAADLTDSTKTTKEKIAAGGQLATGATGLGSLAVPALAPVSVGLAGGNLMADITEERRRNDPALTINSDKAENAGAFIHTEAAPVTIQAPTARTSRWADRRRWRRGS